MKLDIRLPMGALFTLEGAIIALYGLFSRDETALYHNSFGININLIWGSVMIGFGLLCLLLSYNAAHSTKS